MGGYRLDRVMVAVAPSWLPEVEPDGRCKEGMVRRVATVHRCPLLNRHQRMKSTIICPLNNIRFDEVSGGRSSKALHGPATRDSCRR
jgi:hypothetical protein